MFGVLFARVHSPSSIQQESWKCGVLTYVTSASTGCTCQGKEIVL